MKQKLLEHLLSLAFVTLVMLAAVWAAGALGRNAADRARAPLMGLEDLRIDYNDSFRKALLGDVLDVFYPGRHDRNDSLARMLISLKDRQFSENLQSSHVRERLSWPRLRQLLVMYVKFLLVYVIVMGLTYYGVQTIAVWRFCRTKRPRPAARSAGSLLHGAAKAGTGLASFVLFCPAYVIAYSLRTELNTDTVFFMMLLAVISNGLLIVYQNKFYAFLTAESRKGYVETALVRNLHASYLRRSVDGIRGRAILAPVKRFPGHVFGHIFRNAAFQYLGTIKEQASFLITGLIIIEMALNLHGYLSYEMLRQMLYKNYDIVVAIILGIFYTVKITEIVADAWVRRASLRYENRT